MKILIVQENSHRPECEAHRECNCLARRFSEIGHTVRCWGPGHGYDVPWESAYGWCTHVVVCEQYDEVRWVPEIRGDKFVLYWAIDSHCAIESEKDIAKRVGASAVLCAVLPEVDTFDIPGVWWPNAYPVDLMAGEAFSAAKLHGVGFCGTYGPPGRQDALRALVEGVGLHADIMVLGDAMVRAIAGYRVAWNMNIGTDINYRTFETLGIGTLLLTNKTPGAELLFEGGQELIYYTSVDEAVDKARYYSVHDYEREKIAEAGHVVARMRHGYDTRAEHMAQILKKGEAIRFYG